MTKQMQRVLLIVVSTIAGLIVGFFVFKGLMVLLPAIIAGVIGGLVAAILIKGPDAVREDVKRTVQAAMGQPKPRATDITHVLTQALALNQRVRTEDGVSETVQSKVEKIIDIAEGLAPRLCAEFPSDELTYNTCRIVTFHVPRVLEPYLAIHPSDRTAAEPGIAQALDAIIGDLPDIQSIIRDQGIDAARHRAKTVEMKFTGLGGAASAASA